MLALPYAWGEPVVSAQLRSAPEDFQVDEVLGFEPDGEGEHQLLLVRKRGANTEWVARQLARLAKVKSMDVSYAGMKDRHAVTTQWFSVRLAGKAEPDWQSLADDNLQFLTITRHRRKLKRGALKGNRFKIVLRQVQGDLDLLQQRLAQIAGQGVPNYFGEQRFGHDNLEAARAWFAGETPDLPLHQQKILISAARSFLFNEVLAERVRQGIWNHALPGDLMMLNGTHSIFSALEIDQIIQERIASHDIHPTGPLWGNGELGTKDAVLILEQQVLAKHAAWCARLAAVKGLEQDRRSLRLVPNNVQHQRLAKDEISLSFELAAGCYATTVLREICEY